MSLFRLPPIARFDPPPEKLQALRGALEQALTNPVLAGDDDTLAKDESGAGSFAPHLVVIPVSTAEVSAIMRIAALHRAPVTPRGAGSGKSGGCLPVKGGILLLTRGLAALCDLRPDDNLAVVQPGLVLGELQRAALAVQRFYPPDPASADYCTIGGTVAENAAGPKAFKYGVTRDYVMGLEVVLPSGEVVRTGRKAGKSVVGYDLTSLLCGSEGTLGVITEITLELVPVPAHTVTALLTFTAVEAASEAVSRIVSRGVLPSTLELLDPMALRAVRALLPPLGEQVESVLLVELDGASEEGLLSELDRACDVAKAVDCVVAQTTRDRQRLWTARNGVSEALKKRFNFKISEDIAVPRSRIPAMIAEVQRIAQAERLDYATYGHAGDGNLHTNFLWNDPAQAEAVARALAKTYQAAVSLEGTISGEHGVGLVKREFLTLEQAPPVVALQRRIKQLFDPADIMNPGKLFPEERDALLR